jgi:PKD repeat protein
MNIRAPRLLVLVAVATIGALAGPGRVIAQPGVTGQWQTLPTTMPINPIHVGLLRTGKILVVAGSENDSTQTVYRAAVYDPATGATTPQTIPWDLFCNGMTFLADGRALIVGGNIHYYPFYGAKTTTIFDPLTEKFIQVQDMAHGRWYPSNTVLDDGGTVTFGGYTETGSTNQTVEIYDVPIGWSPEYPAPFLPPLYPWMHLLPSGKLFFSGATTESHYFNPPTATWQTNVAATKYVGERTYGSSVLLPISAATGWKPRVMIMGGDNPATATAEVIDLSVATPSWRSLPSMSGPRIDMNAVILPTGKILALGGSAQHNVPSTATYAADLFDPVTETWSSAGANAYPRLYHSVALLLPDGRVWVAGSNPTEGTYDNRMEVYSPAYLFKADGTPAARPTISAAPAVIGWGAGFQISTPNAASIASVVLMRNGSSTHGFDMEQRHLSLSFTAGTGTLSVTSPPNGRIAPPGYYMLFLVDTNGVPSVAKFIQISPTPNNQPPQGTITSPASDVTVKVGQAVNFAGSATDPDGTVASYQWIFPNGTPATSTLKNPGNVTFSAPGTYAVSLTVVDNLGANDPSPAVVNITVQNGPFSASIDAPASGATVSGTVNVAMSATATNLTYTLAVDGTTVFSQPVTGTSASYAWDTRTVSNAAHTLTLTVRDSAGGTATASRTVTVNNGAAQFSASFQYPTSGATVGGTQSVGLATTAPWGQTKTFALSVDGLPITSTPTDGTTLWVDWNTLPAGNGPRTLRLAVTMGTQTATATLPVTVSNPVQPLAASFTSPAQGATVSKTVTVGMQATGASGASNTFRFSVDGVLKSTQTVTTLTTSYAWDSSTVANGTHTLSFTVTDATGRTATATRTVTTSGGTGTAMTAAITSPATNGATVSGTTTIGMSVTNASGSSNTFQLAVDGKTVSSQTVSGTTATYALNTTTVSNGSHTLSLTVTDATLRSATATRTITVSNGTATLGASITAPATDGATVSGTTTVGMAASNAAAGSVTYVLKLDGTTISTQTVASATATYAWNTTGAANGSHTLTLTVTDSATRTATATRTVNVSNAGALTATITQPATGATVSGTTTVSMTASGAASGAITYTLRLDGGALSSQSVSATSASYSWNTTATTNGSHTLTLTVTDSAGRTATASRTVTVSNTTAPFTVSFTYPSAGASVGDVQSVGVSTTAPWGEMKMFRLSVDGAVIATTSFTGTTWWVDWNTSGTSNGSHTLTASVTDSQNRTATATLAVVVSNAGAPPPLVASITAPANGATVSVTTSVGMTETGGTGSMTYVLKVDGTTVSTQTTTATSASYAWNTASVANGSHTLALTVTDGGGRTATASVSVTVSNGPTPPPFTASFTSPVSGATVKGTTTVGMAESGGTGTMTYVLKVDGTTVSTQTTTATTASYAWNTTSVGDGTHTLSLTVTDGSGRTATASRTVTVSNATASFTASFAYPASGALVGGTQSIGMSTTAPWGVDKTFTLKVDGTVIATTTFNGTTWWYDWNTLPATNGAHTLQLSVTVGSETATATLPVTVSN